LQCEAKQKKLALAWFFIPFVMQERLIKNKNSVLQEYDWLFQRSRLLIQESRRLRKINSELKRKVRQTLNRISESND